MVNMKIIVYSTPTCVYCRMAEEFFKEHDVDFEEKDVAQDIKAREEMVEKSGQLGVPVILIDDEVFVGFDKSALSRALKLS
ncbi:MAG: glutaredoxin family protein [Patescibacteria group bacterium]